MFRSWSLYNDQSGENKETHDQSPLTGVFQVQLCSSCVCCYPSSSVPSGFVAIFMSCFSSGFAGVYMEQMLKSKDESIWVRNVQLATCSIIVGLVALYPTSDFDSVVENGFFHGFTKLTLGVILLQAGHSSILFSVRGGGYASLNSFSY